jgi:Gas vesicle protein K
MSEIRRIGPQDVEAAIAELKQQLQAAASGAQQRIDCNSENIEQGLARLVLTVVELLRQLLERQAIRRMEGGSLPDNKVEEMGLALMKLEAKVRELAAAFGLKPEELNPDLGPLGKSLDE